MTELLTAAQMHAIEQAAIDSGEVTGLELMERAGRGVVEAVFEEWPELAAAPHRAVVLCGPGNNGGDGFVVARLLKEWGWEVEVLATQTRTPDAQTNRGRWLAHGLVADLTYRSMKDSLGADLYIDAVFGTGLQHPVTEELGRILRYLAGYGGDRWFFQPKLVAVDIPSGLSSDTGSVPGAGPEEWAPACPYCAITISFHSLKIGHALGDGPDHCGKVIVKSIGIQEPVLFQQPSRAAKDKTAPVGWVLYPSDVRTVNQSNLRLELVDRVSDLEKLSGHHKYTHGHALILSGGPGKGGAARFAARGALRIGAGLVTLGCSPAAVLENAAQLNAIMLRPLENAEALATTLEDTRIKALCLGPGLGVSAETRALVATALGIVGERSRSKSGTASGSEGNAVAFSLQRSIVLDADALTLLVNHQELFAALHDNCVLTPHGGEFARLFPDIAEKLTERTTRGPAYSKVDATREAAKRAGCTILFKGPDTVIADPSGCCSINSAHYDRAAPWLATAGSGDVLAGFITGLLARCFAPMQAAETAAWLHVECALEFGPGLVAEDLPEMLPKVFQKLGI